MDDWFLQRMVRAAEGDDGGGGNAAGDDSKGGEGDKDGGGEAGGDAKLDLTQSDVDAIVDGRLKRERTSTGKKVAEDAGFGSLKEMQDAAKAHQEAETAAKTELEQAQATAATATSNLEAREVELRNQQISNAFLVAAVGAEIPADRVGDALALADISLVEVSPEGVVTGIDEAVKAVVEGKPWLLGKVAGGKQGANGGSGADGGARGDGSEGVKLTDQELEWGGHTGVSAERLAASRTAGPGSSEAERRAYTEGVVEHEKEALKTT